ncbi:unnamed protein product [Musa acuminata subsp. burmannicoides]
MSTERLNKSSDRIKESIRSTLESEEVGVSVLQDLHQQGQPLIHAHLTVCFCANLLVLVTISCTFFHGLIVHIQLALVLAVILILYFKLAH